MKSLEKLYLLYYVCEFEDGHDDVRILGVFSSIGKAKKALAEIIKISELRKVKKNFVIDEDKIKLLDWEEGFITVDKPFCIDLPPFVIPPSYRSS